MFEVNKIFCIINDLFNNNKNDWDILKEVFDKTGKWAPLIEQVCFDTLLNNEQTAKDYCENERPEPKKIFTGWYHKLVRGEYSEDFWKRNWILSLFYIQSSVDHKHIINMMNRIQELFLNKCLETFDNEKAMTVYGAFHRITGAFTALVVESYTHVMIRGLIRLGMNEPLIERVKQLEIKKMIDEVRSK